MNNKKKFGKSRIVISLIGKTLRTAWEIHPFYIFCMVFLIVAQGILPLFQLKVAAGLIDSLQAVIQGQHSLFPPVVWLAFQVAISLCTALLLLSDQLLRSRMAMKVKFFFEHLILRKSTRLSLIAFENPAHYDSLSQANGMGEKGFQILNTIGTIGVYTVTLSSYLVTLVQYNWLLPLFIFIFSMPDILVNIKWGDKRYAQMLQQSHALRKYGYISHLFKSKDSIREIKLYRIGNYLLKKWENIYWKQANEQYQLDKKNRMLNFGFDNLGVLSIFFTSLALVYAATAGKLSLGEYVAMTMAISMSFNLVKSIARGLASLYEDSLFGKRIYDFLDLEEECDPSDEPNKLDFPVLAKKGIEVKNLSFCYPGQEKKVLENISFTIKPNERVALIGYNGAGKSTLIKCLLGLYPVPDGTIYFENIDINRIKKESLRTQMNAVFQDFVKYNFSIRENIGFGNLEQKENDHALDEAAKEAGVFDFIRTLPRKYDTELGSVFAGGQDISGGQWQKIAISRACLRKPPVLVFDEPTSALDPIAEAHLFENMIRNMQNGIFIFISHRLNNCCNSDRILLLKDGKLLENGTHEQLMSQRSLYASMFEKQASGYKEELSHSKPLAASLS